MSYLLQAALLVAALIHIGPLMGVQGGARLDALYGISISDPSLELLMRHRAVLFGLLGVFMLLAVFLKSWQTPAIIAGLVSVVSFLILAYGANLDNAKIARICTVDWVALACLLIAGAIKLKSPLIT
jgi:hypothetical protein